LSEEIFPESSQYPEFIPGSVSTPVNSAIPPEIDGIQVNFCKNPTCANYGVAADFKKFSRRSKLTSLLPGTEYTLSGKSRGAGNVPQLKCLLCGETPPIKSNLGIAEEVERMGAYLWADREVSCPNPACLNHGVSISNGKPYYSSYGKSGIGSQRYKCHRCLKTFSVGKSTRRQRLTHKNKDVFMHLMNKVPFNRICELLSIGKQTLYDKIDFLHRQCLAFIASREQHLMDGMPLPKLYIAVDRQEYGVNWTQRNDKRNVMLLATGSADLASNYVFGMHLNFDSGLEPENVEIDALMCDDYFKPYPFRRYARLWLRNDYSESVMRSIKNKKTKDATLGGEISDNYENAAQRDDVEASEGKTLETALPRWGMQVHAEYSLYGHFFHLKQLLTGVGKFRFFLDQDSGIRAACLAAFQPEIKGRTADAFYVRIEKEITVQEKRNYVTRSKAEFKKVNDQFPNMSVPEVQVLMMKNEMARMATIGAWKDKWAMHPLPDSSEANKAVCYLTDFGDLDPDHMARLYLKATLHPIDRFFQQVRRRISLLERPIGSASNAGRTWYGYSAYQPENIEKLLGIFRLYYNYCLTGMDEKTPAMKLGLAKGVIPVEDIIYFVG